ncbi:MAG: preprotein translocase subunit SecE [Pyrinomonadaceae bacterium]|nr:preprotein translocase subunit SecE [Pyrinomonadaceae bacterium]MCX7640800.1 preprotein translocase subunit SecE [Pyrinomonadaceae bacterium]MDW8303435.1 preprotein translocase subunit SecE [Acidobacteriota bacterium]
MPEEAIETAESRGKVTQYIKETKEELQKVSFPSASDVRGTTVIVIINVIFFAVFLFLIDRFWTYVLDAITWVINSLFGAL